MIDGYPSSFGAKFGKRASACVSCIELKRNRAAEVESTGLSRFWCFKCISDSFVGCKVGVDNVFFLCVGSSGGLCKDGEPLLLCFG